MVVSIKILSVDKHTPPGTEHPQGIKYTLGILNKIFEFKKE